jgi:transcription-repair coupling factor (superfamily II helicase)
MPFDLKKSLPKTGTRFALPALYGSSDAYALSVAALALKSSKQMLVVIVAAASDGQRLLDEIPWFADGKLACHLLPDWETLPYDAFSPHQDLVSERLATLHEVQNGHCDVLIVPATTALVRLAPPSFLASYTFFFKKGEKLDEAKLKSQLTLAGYTHNSQVMSPGEYSVRGGLIDLFPMGSALPYRLDLFGDEIETIRTFDADTQRSLYPVNEVRLLPGREFPMDEAARTTFRSRWRERFEGDPSRSVVYKDVKSGIASAGIEYYLPLFFEQTATLFDYLPSGASVALVGDIDAAIKRFWVDTESRYRFLKADRDRPILAPDEIFLSDENFFTLAKPYGRWAISRDADQQASELSAPIPNIAVNRRIDDPLTNLRSYLMQSDARVMICAESNGRRETLQQYFNEYQLSPSPVEGFEGFRQSDARLALGVAPLQAGFALSEAATGNLIFITETELYAGSGRRAGKKKQEGVTQVESMVRDLSELKIGDPVVHINHGIGRYMGLTSMDLGEGETEFLHLEYQAVCAGVAAACDLALLRRLAGGRAPALARVRPVGKGKAQGRRAGARHRRRTAQPVRPARAAPGPRL